MSRKRKKTDISGTAWINTYADTVTLLLTFFVLLYSMSNVDTQKFEQISVALNNMFTKNPAESLLNDKNPEGEVPIVGEETPQKDAEKSVDLYSQIQQLIDKNTLQGQVKLTKDERGINIELNEKILFDSGKAEIKTDFATTLNKISEIIVSIGNLIEIEGHTDNVPISGVYKNNRDLSYARANSVLEYFASRGISQNRMVTKAYGEWYPIKPNDSDANRAENRRVNILIVVPGDNK